MSGVLFLSLLLDLLHKEYGLSSGITEWRTGKSLYTILLDSRKLELKGEAILRSGLPSSSWPWLTSLSSRSWWPAGKGCIQGLQEHKGEDSPKTLMKNEAERLFFSSSNQNPNIGFSHYVHFPQTFLKISSYIKRKGISTPSGMGIPSKLIALRVAEQEHAT